MELRARTKVLTLGSKSSCERLFSEVEFWEVLQKKKVQGF